MTVQSALRTKSEKQFTPLVVCTYSTLALEMVPRGVEGGRLAVVSVAASSDLPLVTASSSPLVEMAECAAYLTHLFCAESSIARIKVDLGIMC
jgi:hypothetical protein